MNSGSLEDLLSTSDVRLLEHVLQEPESNFVRLGEILKLNKRSAWRYLNLAGTNFSNCDLRGFDFTGADLRGCTGSNVRIDETTILADADLSASIFALDKRIEDIFDEHPDLRIEYSRIRKAYWSDQHNWVADTLTRPVKNPEARRALAMALYFETKDALVRSTIFQYLVLGSDQEDRLAFFARAVSQPNETTSVVVSAINLFGNAYRNDERVLFLLLALVEDELQQPHVRQQALWAALQSGYFSRHHVRLLGLVRQHNSSEAENRYIRAVARTIGLQHLHVVSAGRRFGGVDLRSTINAVAVKDLAAHLWRERMTELAHEGKTRIFPRIQNQAALIWIVIYYLKDLAKRGLPLKLEFDTVFNEAYIKALDDPEWQLDLPKSL